MSVLKKLAGETAIYGLSHILSRVLNFVVLAPYLINKFGEDSTEYGIYSDVYSYSTLLLTILIFRLDTALFRFGSKGDLHKVLGSAFVPMLVGIAAVIALLIPFAQPLAAALSYGDSPHYIRWFVYILAFDALASLIYAKLRLESRPTRFLVYRMGNVLINVLLIIVFFELVMDSSLATKLQDYLGLTRMVDYVFLANLIASATTFLGMCFEFAKVKLSIDIPLIKKMLWYAAPLVVVGIAGSVNQTFSTPIQSYFLGPEKMDNLGDAGVYAAAAKLAILLNLFTTAFNYAAEPFFFKNADKKDATEVYGKVALMYTIVACLGTLGIVVFLNILIQMFPAVYQKGAAVVPFLLIAYVFLGLYYNVSIWYKLKDKTHIGALISGTGVLVTLGVSIWLLPQVGTIASAYAALACYVVMVVIGYLVGQRYFPVAYPVAKILGYIVATSAICYLVVHLQRILDPAAYFVAGISILIAFTAIAWMADVRTTLRNS